MALLHPCGARRALTRTLCILALAAGIWPLAATGPAAPPHLLPGGTEPLALRVLAMAQDQPNGYFILDSPVPLPAQALEVFWCAPGRDGWAPLAHATPGEDHLLAMAPDREPGATGELEFLVVFQGRPWGRATYDPAPVPEVAAPPSSPMGEDLDIDGRASLAGSLGIEVAVPEDRGGLQADMEWGIAIPSDPTPSGLPGRMEEDVPGPDEADPEPPSSAAERASRPHPAPARIRALFAKALGDPRFRSEKALLEAIGLDEATWWGVRKGFRRVSPHLARRLSGFHNRAFPGDPPVHPDYFIGR